MSDLLLKPRGGCCGGGLLGIAISESDLHKDDISSELIEKMIAQATAGTTPESKFATHTLSLLKDGKTPKLENNIGRVGLAVTASGMNCGVVCLGLSKTHGYYASVTPDDDNERKQLKLFGEKVMDGFKLPPQDSETAGLYQFTSGVWSRAYHTHAVHGNSLTFSGAGPTFVREAMDGSLIVLEYGPYGTQVALFPK